jgi:nucleotide-binding universal stress UspA family protein
MYKRILVPVDGSHTSTLGLSEAIKLSKDGGAKLRLIHVVDDLIMSGALMELPITRKTSSKVFGRGAKVFLKRLRFEFKRLVSILNP